MSGLAAATNLPAEMPRFFRDAKEQLGYLNYEPDRWRDSRLPELDEAFEYDHFLDLENVPRRRSRRRTASGTCCCSPARGSPIRSGRVGCCPSESWRFTSGYTLNRTFHRRFETDFVGAKVRVEDLLTTVAAPRTLPDVRASVLTHIRASNAAVTRLYDLEKREPFGPATFSPEHKAFAVERLGAGVEMLRSLWRTAWVTSGQP